MKRVTEYQKIQTLEKIDMKVQKMKFMNQMKNNLIEQRRRDREYIEKNKVHLSRPTPGESGPPSWPAPTATHALLELPWLGKLWAPTRHGHHLRPTPPTRHRCQPRPTPPTRQRHGPDVMFRRYYLFFFCVCVSSRRLGGGS